MNVNIDNMKTQFSVQQFCKYIYLSIKLNKIWFINIEYVLQVQKITESKLCKLWMRKHGQKSAKIKF